jgi:DnaJ-domain-containing protein 1
MSEHHQDVVARNNNNLMEIEKLRKEIEKLNAH